MQAPRARQEECQHCRRPFALRGLKRHEAACKQKLDERQADTRYEQQLLFQIGSVETIITVPSRGEDISVGQPPANDLDPELSSPPETHEEFIQNEPVYKRDDIRTIYHPSSGRATIVDHFEDYRLRPDFQYAPPPIDPHPWRPFASRRNFELAEFILDAALTEKNMKTMFQLLKPEAGSDQDNTEFNIHSPKEFKEHWDLAVNMITPFEKSMVTVSLRGVNYTYNVYRQNLWNWALDLIRDPTLQPYFVWDAVQLSKWNGQVFERFVDEPWTAKAFWDLQTKLPKGGKVLYYIIYADKMRLSSFGTAQGYPVIAHLGNLKASIRNGNGVGGGRVVGWLPVIKENAKLKGKVYYVDFKRRVWHAAFRYILEPIFVPSKSGNFVVLTRGVGSKKPCVVCLVPKSEQNILYITYELRTKRQTQEILTDAAAIPRKDNRNSFLSAFGLRNICENAFWNIEDCDPFRVLSFDGLHAYDNGLFGDHIRKEVISRVEALGSESVGWADDQIKCFPRWRNLYHFESSFMAVHFADGTKYEDLSKHIMFVTHNILTETKDVHGYHLLKCVRSYMELRMYAGFNLHTERSIQAIRDELVKFSELIREYEQLTKSVKPGAKKWNFPKVHSHKHMVDDILEKGVTLNYNTKPNEKMHGPLKDAYQLQTNFKDVAEQILWVDLWCNSASFIRQQIDLHDEQMSQNDGDDELEDEDSQAEHSRNVTLHGNRGKGGGVFTIEGIQALEADDPAFMGFWGHLSKFMEGQFKKYPDIIPEVDGQKVTFSSFHPKDKIQLHGLLKVDYENTVDWTTSTDYLRCSPDFYNHPRYDCLLIDSTDRPFFAQLMMVFTCVIGGKDFPLALVHPFDQPVDAATEKLDDDLGFYRVRARKRKESMFVSVYMIIRGALLVEDFRLKPADEFKEYLIVNYVDSDLFLRMKSLQYAGRRN
ncbi:hypothetical protein EDD18DRAFT_1107781 [Armillaria luteobubalina]|uniref:Uncharacterized protein n=1 Tax=Armillaria luteobubalina TaxID=153913 RepID=A0AA39Q220_9AGAR|nr:hypothetical protein EDD18DRAFT_1107781 [Armillaria luteobubalina]